MSEQTFDPARDPFDPRQERWKGWEESHHHNENIGEYSKWAHGGYQVWRGEPGDYVFKAPPINALNTVYKGAHLPHATVVSILLANGYEPEIEEVAT